MEVLDEVLAGLHHTVAFFYLPEEVSVFLHRRENLIERWFIIAWQKTPRITEACSSYHESVEVFKSCWMYHLRKAVFIAHHITVTDHRDTDMLLQLVDAREVCLAREGLLVRAAMHRDEVGTCILESLYEVYEEVRVLPTETSLD
jgi:hypothetical protein